MVNWSLALAAERRTLDRPKRMVRRHLALPNGDDEFNAFLSELQQETNRAAAVLGAAYLDDLLAELLRASFVDESDVSTSLVKTERPLGAFGARISAAYAFGLISGCERFDLDQARQIRNAFAHKLHGLAFDDESIAARCKTFKLNAEAFQRIPSFKLEYPHEPRRLFDLATALLAHSLRKRIASARRPPPVAPPTGPNAPAK